MVEKDPSSKLMGDLKVSKERVLVKGELDNPEKYMVPNARRMKHTIIEYATAVVEKVTQLVTTGPIS